MPPLHGCGETQLQVRAAITGTLGQQALSALERSLEGTYRPSWPDLG